MPENDHSTPLGDDIVKLAAERGLEIDQVNDGQGVILAMAALKAKKAKIVHDEDVGPGVILAVAIEGGAGWVLTINHHLAEEIRHVANGGDPSAETMQAIQDTIILRDNGEVAVWDAKDTDENS